MRGQQKHSVHNTWSFTAEFCPKRQMMTNKSHDVGTPLEPRILEAHFCPLTKLFMQHLQFQEIWIIVMCLKCLWNKLSINFQVSILFKMTCLTCIMNFILPGIFLQRLFNLFLRIAPATFSRWDKGSPTRRKNIPRATEDSHKGVWNLGWCSSWPSMPPQNAFLDSSDEEYHKGHFWCQINTWTHISCVKVRDT